MSMNTAQATLGLRNGTHAAPRDKASPRLARTVLHTSLLLDFASRKELTAQTGHPVADWLLVILKELLDNSLDACEEARIVPDLRVVVDRVGIRVSDNGPGLPETTFDGVCDFSARVSSREAYVAPDRGAQGNALKTILAMPFVLDGRFGRAEIESQGVRHGITVLVDRIRQTPVVERDRQACSVKTGASVLVRWPDSACSNDPESDTRFLQIEPDDEETDAADEGESSNSACSILRRARSRFLQIAADYAWLNPNLTLDVAWFGDTFELSATDPNWTKWRPSDPTSPHWYDEAALERLLAGYIAHDQARGTDRTLREVVGEFNGLTGTAKQKKVLEETGLARTRLSQLVEDRGLRAGVVSALLTSMREHAKPIKPQALGIMGRAHFERHFAGAGCVMETFAYHRQVGHLSDGRPWIIEAAFGMVEDPSAPASSDHRRELVAGHREPVPHPRRPWNQLRHRAGPSAHRPRRSGDPRSARRLSQAPVHRPRQERRGDGGLSP